MNNGGRQKFDRSRYWATLDGEELIAACQDKITQYYQDVRDSDLGWVWEQSYRAYYGGKLVGQTQRGGLFSSTDVDSDGNKGHIKHLKVNHYRNLALRLQQLITSQKLAFNAMANTAEWESYAQVDLANAVVNHEWSQGRAGKRAASAIEDVMIFGESVVSTLWDETAGDQSAVKLPQGETDIKVFNPLSAVRDINLRDVQDSKWWLVRRYENRWDMAAKYPQYHDELIAQASQSGETNDAVTEISYYFRKSAQRDSDQIPIWTLVHDRTEALPDGRIVEWFDEGVLTDEPLQYKQMPIHCFQPYQIAETPFGYSPIWDALGIQKGLDVLNSTLLTNNWTSGLQKYWSKKGDSISVQDLGAGGVFLESEEMPQALQLTNSAKEAYTLRNEMVSEQEQMTGLNATSRGKPETNLKSGTALALVVSQAIEFLSRVEEEFHETAQFMATSMVRNIQQFASTERVITVVGEGDRPYQEVFRSDDLRMVSRISIEQVNALSKTAAGRTEMANALLDKGIIKEAKDYVGVITTGNLDPALGKPRSAYIMAKMETELMMKGQEQIAVATDHHAEHIREHKSALDNPDARKNPQIVGVLTKHINEHIHLWQTTDPNILKVTGQEPPLNMMGPGGPPPQGPQQPEGGGGSADPAEMMNPDQGPGTPPPPRPAQLPGNLDDGGRAQEAYESTMAENMDRVGGMQ